MQKREMARWVGGQQGWEEEMGKNTESLRSPFETPSRPLRDPFETPSRPLRDPFEAPSKHHGYNTRTTRPQHARSRLGAG
jgi:hypothetical protein